MEYSRLAAALPNPNDEGEVAQGDEGNANEKSVSYDGCGFGASMGSVGGCAAGAVEVVVVLGADDCGR